MTATKPLPDLHKTAFLYKNLRKLKRDGGRAYVGNPPMMTVRYDEREYIEVCHRDEAK